MNKPLFLTLALCTLLVLTLPYLADTFVFIVDRILWNFFGFRMNGWILWHAAFALSIGFLPLWGWVAWRIGRKKTIRNLVGWMLKTTALFLLICLFVLFYKMVKNEIEYNDAWDMRQGPYSVNYLLIAASILSAFFCIVWARLQIKRESRSELLD